MLTGANFINGSEKIGGATFEARAAVDGRVVQPSFYEATQSDIDSATTSAAAAFLTYSQVTPAERAVFLEAVAEEIEGLGDSLIDRAGIESGLPPARLFGERARTCGQLRMFAELLRSNEWMGIRVVEGLPDRTPLPRPDIRRILVPVGPVAVFGASNFPLAFSTAGGDTASALAAGCTVIVKAHPAHPGTSELSARAIIRAVERTAMPAGTFSLLHGGQTQGEQLVQHEEIKAVAFTGSLRAGRALFNLASSREVPIPVFAEMGSVNPLFVLPEAVNNRLEEIAKGVADSVTLGVGQFCTKPGLLIGIGPDFLKLASAVATHLEGLNLGTMLTPAISAAYKQGCADRAQHPALKQLTSTSEGPSMFYTSARDFLDNNDLSEELFGPSAIAICCENAGEIKEIAGRLPGQLTATVHFEEGDADLVRDILPSLTRMAGRVIANGYPTGVEVCSAMTHGGPYPATTDARFTSVGTNAMDRFLRPVSYQGFPNSLLPAALKQDR